MPKPETLRFLFPNQPLSEVCLMIAISAEKRGDKKEAEEWMRKAEREERKDS